MSQGVQTQAPPDGTQEVTFGGKTVSVQQMPEKVFPLRFVQPAHEPSVFVLQTL